MTDHAYWNGHDAKADTVLVRKFFNGWVIRDQKTGRAKLRHLERNSPGEAQAIDALRRLLLCILRRSYTPKRTPSLWPHDDAALEVLPALLSALDPESDSARRVEFKLRKGRRSDSALRSSNCITYREPLHGGREERIGRGVRDESLSIESRECFCGGPPCQAPS
jgi:hypothetical protein